jgi:hypothetical protein
MLTVLIVVGFVLSTVAQTFINAAIEPHVPAIAASFRGWVLANWPLLVVLLLAMAWLSMVLS